MGCTGCLSKTIVVGLNVLFMLAGLGIIGASVYVMMQSEVADWMGKEVVYGCIALGAFIAILAMCAICGACSKQVKKCWMWIYTFFLTILILAQIAVVVIMLTQEAKAQEFLEERWTDNLDEDQRDEIMKAIECGAHRKPIAISPCGGDPDLCFLDCYAMVKSDFTNVGSVIAIVSIAVCAVELVLLVCSCCLLCEDEDDEEGFYSTQYSV